MSARRLWGAWQVALTRTIVAIFYADVAGYSRLTGADEEGSHARVMTLLDDVSQRIAGAGGDVLRYAGDAVLASFPSVVLAVETAVAIQTKSHETSIELPADERVQIRIGINLGDVIEDRGEVFGEGVNLAARLESAAAPGGLCISAATHDQCRRKTTVTFEDAGLHNFKNIEEPVHVFHWSPAGDPMPLAGTAVRAIRTQRPAIAVLPFNSMSDDPEQEHLADGITEDIITALSRSRWYDVTARNTTFRYKGQSPDIREVGKALGVSHVLEGSIRRIGHRGRITVQLIEAESGNHIWAERFDRTMDDEFAVHDEIAQRVTAALIERIWQSVARNIADKPIASYGPHEHAYRGVELLHRMEPECSAQALEHFDKALAMEPDLIIGHLAAGLCHVTSMFWDDPGGASMQMANRHAMRAKELAPDTAQTYRLLTRVFLNTERHDEARECADRALSIDSNDGDIISNKAVCHVFDGAFDEANALLDKVLELHADTPFTIDIMRYWKALSAFTARDYEGSLGLLGSVTSLAFLKAELSAANHARLGHESFAGESAALVLQARSALRLCDVRLWRSFRRQDDQRHLHDALHDAGLPD
jgi:adenylate cyclase